MTPPTRCSCSVYADGQPYDEQTPEAAARIGSYAFAVKLKPGLVHYKAEFGAKTGGRGDGAACRQTICVCGDAYLIDGQSNAEATAWGDEPYPFTSDGSAATAAGKATPRRPG